VCIVYCIHGRYRGVLRCQYCLAVVVRLDASSDALVTTTIRLRFDRATSFDDLRHDRTPTWVRGLLRCRLNK